MREIEGRNYWVEREREKRERERERERERGRTVVSKEFLRYMKSHRNFS